MSKEKKPRFLTPVGEAKWAHLVTPKPAFVDEKGRTKGDPKYMIDVVFDPANDPAWKAWAADLTAKIKALPEQIDKKTGAKIPKQSPLKRELDAEDQHTGRWYVTFKTSDKFRPAVYDLYGKPLGDGVLVGNGSKVVVSYTPVEYEAFGGGITLYLNAVQVRELVEYSGKREASAYGFEVATPPAGGPDDPDWESVPAPLADADDELPF